MSFIEVKDLTKTFTVKGERSTAVNSISFTVEEGQVLSILGPSGCGKSTTLRMLAGAESADSGTIRFKDRVVYDSASRTNSPPDKRDLGMVFQSYALWPHLSVFENVAYPLRRRRVRNVKDKVMAYLELVGCEMFAKRYPSELSGGQQQRIAVARALVAQPAVILFDEPLSNLDTKLRHRLRQELVDLQKELKFTAVYVTHDREEAFTIGNACAVMNAGNIEQLGTASELYSAPTSYFALSFLGETFDLPLEQDEIDTHATSSETLTVNTAVGAVTGRILGDVDTGKLRISLRASDVVVTQTRPETSENVLPCEIVRTTNIGSVWLNEIDLLGQRFFVKTRLGQVQPGPGWLQVEKENTFFSRWDQA